MSSKVTYHQQVSYCGKPRCRKCREGTGHGPYWYAYKTVDGKTTRTYVGKDLPPEALASMEGVQAAVNIAAPNTGDLARSFVRIYTLGQFRLERRHGRNNSEWQTVTDSTWQQQRVRSLLACLSSSAGRKLGREQIMELLWPDLDFDNAAGRLDRSVYTLRQLFEPSRPKPATSPLLLTEREIIVLAEHPLVWIDADVFEKLLVEARETSDPGRKEELLEEAARLYGGNFLPEFSKQEWSRSRRESLRRSWIGLLLELSDLRSKRSDLQGAVAVLDKLLTGMPEIVRAIAEPLSKVDKVTIVSTGAGNGNNGLGASRLTGDIVNMVAQVPALFELLSGTRIGDLMNRVPALAGQENEVDGAKGANASPNGAGTTVEAKASDRNQQ